MEGFLRGIDGVPIASAFPMRDALVHAGSLPDIHPDAVTGVAFGAATDTGRVRRQNEDAFCADSTTGLFAVIDGVGGHAAGRMASAAVADALDSYLTRAREQSDATGPFALDPGLSAPANRLRSAILTANQRLSQFVRADSQLSGMAATLAAALVENAHVTLANVGDCRVYVRRGSKLRQITQDHSWVADQVRAGRLDAETARVHPMRNVVTRALCGSAAVDIDFAEFDALPGDDLLLCSDGLHGCVPHEVIEQCLVEHDDPSDACQQLVALANGYGGPDNVTAVIVTIR
jgi:protein phosphatase